MTEAIVYYGNYTPVGDIIVLATVVVFTILIHSAYPNRSREFYIFRGILMLLLVAAVSNILYHHVCSGSAWTEILYYSHIPAIRWKNHLCGRTKKDADFEELSKLAKTLIDAEYSVYQQDYKVVITRSYKEITNGGEYISLIEYIEKRMPQNEISIVVDNEIKAFMEHKYIVDQLEDISDKKDLDDKRILVFCQPVLNVATGKFDTAEALMRVRLDDIGMVFPDKFIPIAEDHNYIHMLSMIILAKTCKVANELMEEGYYFKRISVNSR